MSRWCLVGSMLAIYSDTVNFAESRGGLWTASGGNPQQILKLCCFRLQGGKHGLHLTTRCPESMLDTHFIFEPIPSEVEIAPLKPFALCPEYTSGRNTKNRAPKNHLLKLQVQKFGIIRTFTCCDTLTLNVTLTFEILFLSSPSVSFSSNSFVQFVHSFIK